MSHHKLHHIHQADAGFTLVELLLVILLIGVLGLSIFGFTNTTIVRYFQLQKDGSNFTNLASQSQRVASVLRGTVDIVSESSNDLVVYAYFSPIDTYASQIHYYEGSGNTTLMADVTPMTANPPTGTLITAQKKTYTIIPSFYQVSGINLFNYFDASNTQLSLPVSDEHTIQSIQINLAAQGSNHQAGQSLFLQVDLRNRKTNL